MHQTKHCLSALHDISRHGIAGQHKICPSTQAHLRALRQISVPLPTCTYHLITIARSKVAPPMPLPPSTTPRVETSNPPIAPAETLAPPSLRLVVATAAPQLPHHFDSTPPHLYHLLATSMPRDQCRSLFHFVIYLALLHPRRRTCRRSVCYECPRAQHLNRALLTDDIIIAAQNLIAPSQRGQANKPWLPSMG